MHSRPAERPTESHGQKSMDLDMLAQQPRLNRLYTQLTYCFRLVDDNEVARENIVSVLRDGLQQLRSAVPWVSGCVVHDAGGFKIEVAHNEPRLLVKDLRQAGSGFTWQALVDAHFPFCLLHEEQIAPLPTLVPEDSHPAPLPVLLLQANFIAGGLLLTFNAQHGSMDIVGQAEVIRLLAKACCHEAFTDHELQVANMSRQGLIPLLDDDDDSRPRESENETKSHQQEAKISSSPPAPPIWAYMAFTADALSKLKDAAMEDVSEEMFVSTDDALSALVWQSITRARVSRLASSQRSTTLSRNVNVRRHFSIPPTYPGFVAHSTTHTWRIDALTHSSLSAVALELRRALEPAALRHSTQRSATSICRHGTVDGSAAKTPELDVRLSSWVQADCCHHDFGPKLGTPRFVRRPQFTHGAREGLVYFLPKSDDGEIVVGVCLRPEDLHRLREDPLMVKYVSYIG